MIRSVLRLFLWPRASSIFGLPSSSTSIRRRPYPPDEPTLNPIAAILLWPANTFTDNSRLYSPAIARLMFFRMVAVRLPSLSNCSAQYSTDMPASLQMNS